MSFNTTVGPSTTAPLAALVERLFGAQHPTNTLELERRIEPRFNAAIPVVVRMLDADQVPIRPPIQAITRDISSQGLSILLVECQFGDLLVNLTTHGLATQVVLHVAHCTPLPQGFIVGGPVSPWIENSTKA